MTDGSRPEPRIRSHVLCLGAPMELLRRARDELRVEFEGSHRIDIIESRAEAVALVRALRVDAPGRGAGDELEAIIAALPDPEPELETFLQHFPLAQWVFLGDPGGAIGDGERLTPPRVVPVPWQGNALTDAVRAAIDDYRAVKRADLVSALRRIALLKDLPAGQIEWLADRVEVRRYETGQTVVTAGEPGDGVFLIRVGQVKVLGAGPGGEQIIARLGRHEQIGEMALLTGAPRSNSVVTTLDSEMFFLSKQHFDELIAAQPGLGIRLSQILSAHLRRVGRPTPTVPRIIVCHSATGDGPGWQLAERLAGAIAAEAERDVVLLDLNLAHPALGGESLDGLLDRLEVREAIPRDRCVQLGPRVFGLLGRNQRSILDRLLPSRIAPLLELLNDVFGFVVVAAGTWLPVEVLIRLARQCDVFLLLADSSVPSPAAAAAATLELIRRESPTAERKVAVVAEPLRATPAPLAGLIGYRVPLGRSPASDLAVRRAARRILGIGVGLTLSGGGARCAAHIGAIEVFEREGIPIDLVGGTSGGALVGGAYAIGMSIPEMIEQWHRGTSTSTLFSSRRAAAGLHRLFGDAKIEELPVSYFAVAADLVAADVVVLDRGSLRLAIQAAVSIPGVVAPVAFDGLQLVDGGVGNNVPADLVKKRGARLTLVLDVTRQKTFAPAPPRGTVGSWLGRALREVPVVGRILDAPGIIMRAMEIQAIQTVSMRSWAVDVHIHPEVGEVSAIDFGHTSTLVDRGRAAAAARLPEIRAKLRSLIQDL